MKKHHQHEVFISLNQATGNFYITFDKDKPLPICNRCLYNIMNHSGPARNFCGYCLEVMSIEDKAKAKNK